MVQLIQAAFVNILIFKYIKKHSKNIFTCVFFYFWMGYTGYTMEIMRGSMSIALCLFGNDYIIEKKWFKGYLLYALALCFHAQTIVLFLLPMLFFLRFNKLGILVLIGAYVAGYIIQIKLGGYLELLELSDAISEKAENYAESDTYGKQGGNLNFFIVYIFPKILYGLLSLLYIKKYISASRLLRLEPFLMLGVLFLMVQMSLQIAYRYVDYYMIYFVLFISEFSVEFSKKVSLSKGLSLLRTFIVLFPFLFLTTYVKVMKGIRYYPYSSIIERKINLDRENHHNKASANINEF